METMVAWVGVAVGILGVLAAVAIYILQRKTKHLDYEIITNREIMSRTLEFPAENLQVSFKGHRIEDPRLVVLRIRNSGQTSIRPDDFETPLQIALSENSVIVSSEVSRTNPPELQPKLGLRNDHELYLEPLLLNQKDWIELQLLVDGEVRIVVSGRVVDVRSIRDFGAVAKSKQRVKSYLGLIGGFVIGGLFYYILTFLTR